MPTNNNIDNPDEPGEQTDGPVSVPITIQPSNPGPIVAYTDITANISMDAAEAGSSIYIEYFEDDNPPQPIGNLPQVAIPARNLPSATWRAGSTTGTVIGSFVIKINAAQVNNFTNPQSMDLVVLVTSGNGEGILRIPIAFP